MAKNNAFRLGRGSVSKVFALQAERPQIDDQNIHLKRARCGDTLVECQLRGGGTDRDLVLAHRSVYPT